jgi:hypothetical protein
VKLAIVCSSAEPGRDGVGDYSVRLASSLIAGGHCVLVIAARDAAFAGRVPDADMRSNVRVVRYPASAGDAERGRWLATALEDFAPDWVVLQFVCWGFADRGVLTPPPVALIAALSGRRVAIYCHELWLALDLGASLRHRWWGRQQRQSILRFLALLHPAVVLTSNPVYAAILQRYGWAAQIVPLVGNIPVHAGAAADVVRLLEQRNGRPAWNARHEVFVLALFGTLLPAWDPGAALQWLQGQAQRRGRNVLVVSIGRPSPAGEALLARLAQRSGPFPSFHILGEAAPRLVSGLLQEADAGLPSTDWMLLGKSGVAAAMLEHGLPMLVVRNSQAFRDLPDFSVSHPQSIFRFNAAAPPDFDSLAAARGCARDTLPEIARELVTILERAN